MSVQSSPLSLVEIEDEKPLHPTFAEILSSGVPQKLMRHAQVSTTMRYGMPT
jgi:hypothetical protein